MLRHPDFRESERARHRVDQALVVLRRALAEYLATQLRSQPNEFNDSDLTHILSTFIQRFAELPQKPRVRTLAFAAKDARNDIAHYKGTLTPDQALHYISTVRQLLQAIGADARLHDVDNLYQEQIHALQPNQRTAQPNHSFTDSEQSAVVLTQADRIRSFATKYFVEPARNAGHQTVSIRAGDVGARMKLGSNIPNVCNALGGRKFGELAAVTLLNRSGPNVGSNTEFTYTVKHG